MKDNRYYVELDCLLDTRLGSLACFDIESAAKLATVDAYHERQHNQLWRIMDGLPKQACEELWEHRKSIDTLIHSRVTKFTYQLRGLIDATRVSSAFIPFKQTGSVYVDVHGWGLSDEDKEELKESLKAFLDTNRVHLVNIGVDNLTPKRIRKNYHSVSMIDFDKWVNIHIEELTDNRIPSVGFHCPAILLDPDDKECCALYKAGLTQDGVREGFATSLRLTFYDPGQFSIIKLE